MSVATKEELYEYAGKDQVWTEFGGDLNSNRADFVSAIAEYNDWRYSVLLFPMDLSLCNPCIILRHGEKLTKQILVDGKELPITYKILNKEDYNKGKVITSSSSKTEDKDEKKGKKEKKEKTEKKEKKARKEEEL